MARQFLPGRQYLPLDQNYLPGCLRPSEYVVNSRAETVEIIDTNKLVWRNLIYWWLGVSAKNSGDSGLSGIAGA
jgi:hypothetical protein